MVKENWRLFQLEHESPEAEVENRAADLLLLILSKEKPL